MFGGNDIVTLSNVNLGGFSNRVNGNNGSDQFTALASSQTRDFVLGGPETDIINLTNSTAGADWQNGNKGDDQITGGNQGTVRSILRGGSGNDTITINAGSTHIAVGDFGKDTYILNGAGRLVLRTDDGTEEGDSNGLVQRNAAQNASEADIVTNFTAFDKAYVPGVADSGQLIREQVGGDTYLKAQSFTNGTTGMRYIAKFNGITAAALLNFINNGQIITGDAADRALRALTPDNFLNDANLGGVFD
jgi:hypothetical protein